MITKDEAFREYAEKVDKIDKEAHEAKKQARIILWEQLKALQAKHHEELKAIRAISQKTKGSK